MWGGYSEDNRAARYLVVAIGILRPPCERIGQGHSKADAKAMVVWRGAASKSTANLRLPHTEITSPKDPFTDWGRIFSPITGLIRIRSEHATAPLPNISSHVAYTEGTITLR